MSFAVITENDESQWDDETGTTYHFPARARPLLAPGTRVIYYKGKMRNRSFAAGRLSEEPHYFGIATVDTIVPDRDSSKGDLYALLRDYHRFDQAVGIKDGGAYLEQPMIRPTRVGNYWRDGTRVLTEVVYRDITSRITASVVEVDEAPVVSTDPTYESGVEGQPTMRFVSGYERKPKLRALAKAIHGTRCFGCAKTSAETYGQDFAGLIHIHHLKPVSTTGGPVVVDPATDLVPLCPNCHAVVHSKRHTTLSLPELRLAFTAAASPMNSPNR